MKENKFTIKLKKYFEQLLNVNALSICKLQLRKVAEIELDISKAVDTVDIWELLNEKWHSAIGYPPDNWTREAEDHTLLQWWILVEFIQQCKVGTNVGYEMLPLYIEIQEAIEAELGFDKVRE